MPLEVSPIPFNQQLPYTPKFVRPDLGGSVAPSGEGGLAQGPASVAASAIIGPVPGGIAGPYDAIPALPDAGYTAAALRPVLRSTDPRLGYGLPSSRVGQSVYAGASLYDHPNPAGHRPQSVHGSDWGSNSLPVPGPRRVLPALDILIPPTDQHHHHHHHQTQHQHPHDHHRDRQHPDDDDKQSDCSYYAAPKPHQCHTTSPLSVISSSEAGATENHHRPSGSQAQPARRHRSPSMSTQGQEVYSANPSPLGQSPSIRFPSKGPPSPNAQKRHGATEQQKEQERKGPTADVPPPAQAPAPVDGEERPRRPSNRHRHRSSTSQGTRAHKTTSPAREGADVPPPLSNQVTKPVEPSQRPPFRHHKSSGHVQASEQARSRRYSGSHLELPRDKQRPNQDGPLSADPYDRPHHVPSIAGENHRHHHPTPSDQTHHRHTSEHHRHRRAGSAGAAEHSQYFPSGDNQHKPAPPTSHRHQRHDSQPHRHQQHHHQRENPQEYQQVQRRRAVSLQGVGRPSPRELRGGYPQSAYDYGPNVNIYDDGASLAGSAMTFMDGPIGGKTSQYGLPKYVHQPKPDYRRFCVQRGTADVFLD